MPIALALAGLQLSQPLVGDAVAFGVGGYRSSGRHLRFNTQRDKQKYSSRPGDFTEKDKTAPQQRDQDENWNLTADQVEVDAWRTNHGRDSRNYGDVENVGADHIAHRDIARALERGGDTDG